MSNSPLYSKEGEERRGEEKESTLKKHTYCQHIGELLFLRRVYRIAMCSGEEQKVRFCLLSLLERRALPYQKHSHADKISRSTVAFIHACFQRTLLSLGYIC